MFRKHKLQVILSSLAIFLPCIFGLVMWDKLPLNLTIHWGADGAADGWGSKAFAIFGIPAVLFVFHWLCVLITHWDWKRRGEQSGKVFNLVLWITPYISALVSIIMYSVALGYEIGFTAFTVIPLGLLFVIIGNYMPKVKRNRTMGIKVKWALENDENWYATHRLAGKVWTIGGFVMMLLAFIPGQLGIIIPLVAIIPVACVPAFYSYLFYRKQLKEGNIDKTQITKKGKIATGVSVIITVLLLAVLIWVLFTGDVNVSLGDDSFTVEASFYSDLTVKYEDIDSIEYYESDEKGSRVGGFGSPRLSMGNFRNDEFGTYTRYSYTACDSAIVIRDGDKVLVLSGKDAESTKALYEELIQKIK